MNSEVILLTGITGFLGSHLAEHLSVNYLVIGLIRNSSNLWRYDEIKNDNILLINADQESYYEELAGYEPRCLIHCAWGGVSATDRDNWDSQLQNINLTFSILNLARRLGIKQFIGLGSQAEYGNFSGSIDESFECYPTSPYGACKLASKTIVQAFCTQHQIAWQWLRIFPMYGTREDFNWFIPSAIRNAILNQNMEYTGCEQKYGYLYVKDFCKGIEKVLQSEFHSGVYNLAASSSIQLKEVIETIRKKTNTAASFKIGALPYRPNQVMHMEGNSHKFFKTFDFFPLSDFDDNINTVIKYYKKKLLSETASE